MISCGDDGRVCVGDFALWKVKDKRADQRFKLVQYVISIVEEAANQVQIILAFGFVTDYPYVWTPARGHCAVLWICFYTLLDVYRKQKAVQVARIHVCCITCFRRSVF